LAAVAFSLHQQKLYQASAQVLITNQSNAQNLLGQQSAGTAIDPTRQANTDMTVAQVPEVARRTLAALGLHDRSGQDLLNHTVVSAASDADILTFSITDPNRSLAVRLVNEYANQFIEYRQQLDTASVTAALKGVNIRIHDLKRRVASGNRSDPVLADQLHNLLQNQGNLQTLQQLQGGKLFVVRAASSAGRVQPKVIRNGLIGIALGVIFGLSLAFLVHALDTRVRSADEVAATLGLGLIARIPTPPRSLRKRHRLAMLERTKHSHREAYSNLRTGFDLANLKLKARTILVTSAVEREGKSTTVANLAVALARAGHHVALIDLDLRRPVIAKFFDLEGPGVTSVAMGAAPLQDALTTISVGHAPAAIPKTSGNGNGPNPIQGLLDVIPSGPLPADPVEFLTTKELIAIIEHLRERCDLVLIDSPPALPVGDPMALSSVVDAMLIVVRAGVIRRRSLTELHRLLDTAPAAKMGFVLTGAEMEDDYTYGGGYGYDETDATEVARPTVHETQRSARP
jgi:Mrp family chromosome partitioning ATPase/capsular polysaccharide biosynthesis protein